MSGYRYSVLVVDDEDAVRKLTIRALERHGFHCTEAADGAEAAQLLATRHYHALVSDLRMPGGNGYSLTTDVLERTERPLIVILTGVMEPRLAQDLLRRGVDDIMFKPVDYEMFAGKVAALMERRIDQGPNRNVSATETASPEMNGLATPRETKALISGQAARQSDSGIPNTGEPVEQPAAAPPMAVGTQNAPINADVAESSNLTDNPSPNGTRAEVAATGISDGAGSMGTGSVIAAVAEVRRWAATAMRHLPTKELAWLAAAGSLMFSVWLSVQLHMVRQMNRAVDVLEQLGRRIVVSKTSGASVRFEADRRPSGLETLHRVPDLHRVELAHTRATDEDLKTIGALTDVEELDLEETEITDAGLAYLENLNHLRRLSLRGTQVTDAGVGSLRRLRSLRAVSLLDTRVSAEGARKLKQAMPLTRIDHAALVPTEVDPGQPGNR